jgi:transcriptional regulator with XRE-family HTH domain
MSADPVFDELLAEDAALRDRWCQHEPVRELALALVGMRRQVGMSQKELAAVAGWDPAYVSRLESGRGPMPEASTVQRYAEACGGTSAYVLFDRAGEPVSVHPLARGGFGSSGTEEVRRKLAELEEHFRSGAA